MLMNPVITVPLRQWANDLSVRNASENEFVAATAEASLHGITVSRLSAQRATKQEICLRRLYFVFCLLLFSCVFSQSKYPRGKQPV